MSVYPVTGGVLGAAIGLLLAAASPLAAQSMFAAAPEPRHEERSQADPSAPQATPPVGPSAEALAADVLGLRRFRLDPGFAAGVPVGEFGNNASAAYGGAIDLGVGLGRTPIFVGAALDYLRYGTETRRIALFPALPDVLSDVDTTNNLFRAHALVRVQPRTGRASGPTQRGCWGSATPTPAPASIWATTPTRRPRTSATTRRASGAEAGSRSCCSRDARRG